jgi:hemolysin III
MNDLFVRDRSNEIVSGLLHLVGAGFSIVLLVVLAVLGAGRGSGHVVGYVLYGTGLILLYVASASYHLMPERWPRAKRLAQRFDHGMIYVLIAATYMPVCFIVLDGGWRWSFFGVIWGLALIGLCAKLCALRLSPFLSTGLSLTMGWLISIAFSPLLERLSPVALALLILGGVAYTLGVAFFVLEGVLPPRRYFWMHEIFHVFVLLGSAFHGALMFFIL